MVSRLASFGPADPCGEWQSEQLILPSWTGWRHGLFMATRVSLWHAKQTSDCAALLKTGSLLTWIVWQPVQPTSACGCVLPAHSSSFLLFCPSWQTRQTALASEALIAPLPLKRCSGFAALGSSACFSLMPWQPTQPKLRESAATACGCFAIFSWSAPWHIMHFADGPPSCACAGAAKPSKAMQADNSALLIPIRTPITNSSRTSRRALVPLLVHDIDARRPARCVAVHAAFQGLEGLRLGRRPEGGAT